MLTLFLISLMSCLLFVSILWFISTRTKNAGIIDVYWALLISGSGLYYFFAGSSMNLRQGLVALAVSLWGFRLSLHIGKRYFSESKEDARYQKLKEIWGKEASFRMLRFYWIQGITAAIFSIPFLVIFSDSRDEILTFEFLGFCLWVIAFLGETIADYQLSIFKGNPLNSGKVCRLGLWNYSRHPNYFFEWLIWVSYFFMASQSSWGVLTIIFPISMLYFLLKVTGIPLAEKQSLESKGDAYRKYQSEVSSFIPWFPKGKGV